jgi:hypothetical protein
VCYENHFLVLPDGKTIIGVEYKGQHNVLFMEDISRNDVNAYRQIATYGYYIYTVFYNSVSKSLFVGENSGKVAQYQRDVNGETWTMAKDYGNIGIGHIFSVDQIEDIVIFGGGGSHSVRANDSKNKNLLQGTLKTAICYIYSLQVCELPENKVYLSVCGQNQNYTNTKTDIYNATELAKTFGFHFQSQEKFEEIPKSESSKDKSIEDFPEETSTPTPCGCNIKKAIDSLLEKLADYLEDFQSIICSNFTHKIKSLIGK